MLARLMCWLGLHDWMNVYTGNKQGRWIVKCRECRRCGKGAR